MAPVPQPPPPALEPEPEAPAGPAAETTSPQSATPPPSALGPLLAPAYEENVAGPPKSGVSGLDTDKQLKGLLPEVEREGKMQDFERKKHVLEAIYELQVCAPACHAPCSLAFRSKDSRQRLAEQPAVTSVLSADPLYVSLVIAAQVQPKVQAM